MNTPPAPPPATAVSAHQWERPAIVCSPIIVSVGITAVAVCWTSSIAARVVQLLDRHGLADVPDQINTWPAPTGRPVHTAPVRHG